MKYLIGSLMYLKYAVDEAMLSLGYIRTEKHKRKIRELNDEYRNRVKSSYIHKFNKSHNYVVVLLGYDLLGMTIYNHYTNYNSIKKNGMKPKFIDLTKLSGELLRKCQGKSTQKRNEK